MRKQARGEGSAEKMRYAQAVTDEREKYRQEQKAIYEGRITARSADGYTHGPYASI